VQQGQLPSTWLTLANGATFLRAAAIPLVLVLLAGTWPGARLGAAGVFLLAALTDALDGYLARRGGTASLLGLVLDLTADKLLIAIVLIALVGRQEAPAWAAVAIVSREIVVSAVRTYAAARQVVLAPQTLGKVKMVVTSAAVGAAIARLPGAPWLLALAVVLTLASSWPYLAAGARLARSASVTGGPPRL
jgi:CDP-diacylglycerol--glycerol-3-phosphate 3-phosphatidyltransferase